MNASVSQVSATVSFSRMSAVLCVLFAVVPLHAAPRTEQEVAAAVETWLQGVITDARADATVERMEPHVVDGETVAYVVHLAGGGFCLSGADDLVLPVYFYNPNGDYNAENPNYELILHEIALRRAKLQESVASGDAIAQTYEEALTDRAMDWADLAARRVPERDLGQRESRGEPDLLVLPLTATWGQGSPYNDQTPAVPGPPYDPPPNEGHTKVGCVATAMAQIMYYWKWPETGVGTYATWWAYHTFDEWESTPLLDDPGISGSEWPGRLEWTDAFNPPELRMGGNWDATIYTRAIKINSDIDYRLALATLWGRSEAFLSMWSADFGATTYDWDLMQDRHNDADGVDDGDIEAAKLSYHCGVAVKMEWGRYSSSATVADVGPAMVDFFRYDPDVYYWPCDRDRMTTEILWLRPLLFRADDANGKGGHAWVVYGYDKSTDPNRRFWMNMGWDGTAIGWYTLDDITPNDWDFSNVQWHVLQIAPRSVVEFVGGPGGGDGTPGAPYVNVATAAANAPAGARLIFKAGSANTFAGGPLVIDRPLKLTGYDVTIAQE